MLFLSQKNWRQVYTAVSEVFFLFQVIFTTKISRSFRDCTFNSKCKYFVYLVIDGGLCVDQRKPSSLPHSWETGEKTDLTIHYGLKCCHMNELWILTALMWTNHRVSVCIYFVGCFGLVMWDHHMQRVLCPWNSPSNPFHTTVMNRGIFVIWFSVIIDNLEIPRLENTRGYSILIQTRKE